MATSNPWLSACYGEVTPFGHAVDRLLESWTALQLIVENQAGGQDSEEKAKWLVYAIEVWFKENKDIREYELSDFLTEVFETEFEDVVIDDSSIPQIAREICAFYRLYSAGQLDELETKLQHLPKAAMNRCRRGPQQQEMEGEMDEDASGTSNQQPPPQQPPPQQPPPQQPQHRESEERPMDTGPDDDGWQVVQTKGKGKRK